MGYGITVGRHAVAMLIRRAGLTGLPGNRRPRRHGPSVATASDLVDRQFTRIWGSSANLLPVAARYEEKGPERLRDRSSRPRFSPNATSAELVGKIIYVRQNYHFGPGKFAMYLEAVPRNRNQQIRGVADLQRLSS